eukprot:2812822-Pyramimonas_sp.AAC.1
MGVREGVVGADTDRGDARGSAAHVWHGGRVPGPDTDAGSLWPHAGGAHAHPAFPSARLRGK